jgi:hypothetical protein
VTRTPAYGAAGRSIVRERLAVHIWVFGVASGGTEHLGYGGELGNVYRTGGIDHDDRAEPQRAGWFTPQLLVAACAIEMACVTVASAGPVPGPGQIQRNGAVHLDEPAGKHARQRERIAGPGAIQHRAGAGTDGAQHRGHGGLAEALRGGHRFWPARALHEGFLDLVLGQQRQAQPGGERRSQRALADPGQPATARTSGGLAGTGRRASSQPARYPARPCRYQPRHHDPGRKITGD